MLFCVDVLSVWWSVASQEIKRWTHPSLSSLNPIVKRVNPDWVWTGILCRFFQCKLHPHAAHSSAYHFWVFLPPINGGKPLLPYNVKHHILSLLYLENILLWLECASNKICNALLWLINGKYSDCDLHLPSMEILGKYHLLNKVKPSVFAVSQCDTAIKVVLEKNRTWVFLNYLT